MPRKWQKTIDNTSFSLWIDPNGDQRFTALGRSMLRLHDKGGYTHDLNSDIIKEMVYTVGGGG